MAVFDYVSRRMLFDVCDIAVVPLNEDYEVIYEALYKWMECYTEQFGSVFYNLPAHKTTQEELLNDMVQLFTGIFERVSDIDSITTLHALFTVSFYMMIKYKDQQVSMCGSISYYFKLITQNLKSWDTLQYLSMISSNTHTRNQ